MRAIGFILIVACVTACGRRVAVDPVVRPTRAEVWAAIQPIAARYQLAPEFIYAVVAAESGFDPAAHHGDARGLMQLKPATWRTVSSLPYEPNVWDWRESLRVGVDCLASERARLHRKGAFSYPLLLAAFHYGPDYVEARDFDVRRIPAPAGPIYRELWSGNLAPVPPPTESAAK